MNGASKSDSKALPGSSGTSRHAHKLCEHSQLPEWAHDNAFIIGGYRRPGGTNDEAQIIHASITSAEQTAEVPGLRKRVKGSSNQAEGDLPIEASAQRPRLFEHNSVKACWDSVWLYWHNETGERRAAQHSTRCEPRSVFSRTRSSLNSSPSRRPLQVNIHTHLWGCIVAIALLALHFLA
ncbi:hypothetical protein IE81DRAFT_299668, partial [Ceraceosorus guamensis]